jgi:hypothetical protein
MTDLAAGNTFWLYPFGAKPSKPKTANRQNEYVDKWPYPVLYCSRWKMKYRITISLCGQRADGQTSMWHRCVGCTGIVGGKD